jgi:hypothetical protein
MRNENYIDFQISNNIDQNFLLELKFEIKRIELKLKEEKTNLDWILFKMESFGMNLEIKSYQTALNIYLNHLVCRYGLLNDVNGKKLYLFSPLNSHNRESNEIKKLININLTKTDMLNSRDRKENAPTNVDIDMGNFAIVFNLIAFKKIFDYVETLQHSFYKFESSQLSQADFEFLKKSNISIEHKNNIPLLNDAQIKRLAQTKTKLYKPRHSALLTNLKINLNVDAFRLRFMTKKVNYYYLDLKKTEILIMDSDACLTINVLIKTGVLKDLEPNAIFSEILSIEEEKTDSLIHFNVKVIGQPKTHSDSSLEMRYNSEINFFKKYFLADSFDIFIKANVPRLRHVLFYKHWDVFLVNFTVKSTVKNECNIFIH